MRVKTQTPKEIFGEWIRVEYTAKSSWSVKVLNETDNSDTVILVDKARCPLCRDNKIHSELLHEDLKNNADDPIPVYADDEDAMEWEILNAEAEGRPINWEKKAGRKIGTDHLVKPKWQAILAGVQSGSVSEWQRDLDRAEQRNRAYTQQQIDAMWQ